jgi:predicted DNA-binding ribbon-helix-helix protein
MTMQKRSVTISGHRTSIALEPEFWAAFEGLALTRGLSVPQLIAEIDEARGAGNLASAIRLHVLKNLQRETAAQ